MKTGSDLPKRALVTGGAGFIGSHLTDALIQAGCEVLVVDDLSTGRAENLNPSAKHVQVSIAAPEIRDIVMDFRPEAVLHHAAQIDVRRSVSEPALDAEINVVGTCRVAAAAVEAGAKVLTFASSGGAIYGEQDVFPATEDHPYRPTSPYGTSKLCGENYLEYFGRSSDMRVVCLRYGNVYGPRQDPHGEAGVVAIFAGRLLDGQPITINGDGKQTRDYVFVHDVVKANLLALQSDAQGAFNIGTGVETDVNELAALVARAASAPESFSHGPAKAGEQLRSVIAFEKAKQELDWQPTVSIEDGIAQTVAWFSEQH